MDTFLRRQIRMKSIKTYCLIAAAVVITAACQVDVREDTAASTVAVRFSAGMPATRVAFAEPAGTVYPALWQQEDQVKLLLNSEEITTGSTRGVLTAYPSSDGKKADFSADLSGTEGMGSYTFDLLYPASAFVSIDMFSG